MTPSHLSGVTGPPARTPTSARARAPRPRGAGRTVGGKRSPPHSAPALELPGARRVDQHAVPEAGAELRHVAILHRRAGIDGRAEDAGEDHDAALAGIHAVRERPVHLLVRRGIDVLLHHDHVLVAVLRGAVAPQRRRDLLGLALVVLLDLHHGCSRRW